ncbi:fluoride efflux transporter CrcB [Thiocapsa roseopersicina]|uniref:Fluoride-specific ion channel FluC n=1 Tax=Thiocapsa roseopersicina TaxID=1058 RepID=A0A1H3A350_THIRO|nr:fluoride efflux transporter CrcB [Thiocapsa roseopersicina]SDX24202.1 camphor resistance protein CrcB [Thiocapsa roseopersicina]
MLHLIAIAAGGALGSLARYGMSSAVYAWLGRGFPWGTLAVNLFGSFLMGLLFVVLIERLSWAPEWRGAILIGFLGAFTTFSTFSIETLNLLEEGAMLAAFLNMVLSVWLCVLLCWAGIILGRSL